MAKRTLDQIMARLSPQDTRGALEETKAGLVRRLAALGAGYGVESDNSSYDEPTKKRVLGGIEREMRLVDDAIVIIDKRLEASDEALKEAEAALWKPGGGKPSSRPARRRAAKAEAKSAPK